MQQTPVASVPSAKIRSLGASTSIHIDFVPRFVASVKPSATEAAGSAPLLAKAISSFAPEGDDEKTSQQQWLLKAAGDLHWQGVVGFMVCLAVLIEGVVALCYAFSKDGVDRELTWPAVGLHNPMAEGIWVLIKVLGIGDCIVAVGGVFSLWLCSVPDSALLPNFARWRSFCAKACVVALFAWRCLVTLVAVPCCGVTIAFRHPMTGNEWGILYSLLYAAANLVVLCGLLGVVRALWAHTCLRQLIEEEEAEKATAKEKLRLLSGLPPIESSKEESFLTIFCMLPLASVTAVYLIAIGAASIFWFVDVLIHEHIIAGWVFTVHAEERSVVWIPAIFYALSAASIVPGYIGITAWYAAQSAEALAKEHLDEGCSDDAIEAAEVAQDSMQLAGNSLLISVLGQALRFMYFIPATGMVLLETSTCSWFLTARASLGVLGCHTSEVGPFVGAAIFCFFDCYCLVGLIRLTMESRARAASKEQEASPAPSYGALEA